MRSRARRPLGRAPPRWARACRGSRRDAALSTSAGLSAPSPGRLMVPRLPGPRRPGASGAVQQWERLVAGRGWTSAPTTPNGASGRSQRKSPSAL
jgi:hypothetical protein